MDESDAIASVSSTALPRQRAALSRWWQALRALGVTAAVAVSLLVFPSMLLWMVGCWLVAFSLLVLRRCAGWLPLVACVAVLVIKRPDWSPALITLAAVMTAVAAMRLMLPGLRRSERRGLTWVVVAALWAAWGVALWQSYLAVHQQRLAVWDPSRPVVCFGDSLTTGLTDDEAYPVYLQGRLHVPVINLGRAGSTTQDALSHLREMATARPQLVIIELGGNDYLRGHSRAEVRSNLVQIIEAARAAGTDVLLCEIPRGFVVDPYSGLERELARTYDLQLVPDTAIRMLVLRSDSFPWADWLGGPRLSDDGLHPNVAGARHLAEGTHQQVDRMYKLGIDPKGT